MTASAINDQIRAALALIARTPDFAPVASDLAGMQNRNRIRFVPTLADRGQATLGGAILLGPEVFGSDIVGLAETLVHEHFHLRRQTPLHKTASFWCGIALGQPVMRAYEQPAYAEAARFLRAVETAFPDLADEARAECDAVEAAFAAFYGG